MKPDGSPIRVLIVDDSALVRSVLQRGFSSAKDIVVVGAARDPYEARDLLVRERPDVMTLDVEMPRMDGVTFLRKTMAVLPTPVIVLSSLTTNGSTLAVQALDAGAVDVVAKPSSLVQSGLEAMMAGLIAKVRAAAATRVRKRPTREAIVDEVPTRGDALGATTDTVIGIGASTGGVAAIGRILPAFPPWTPGIVIVQHMPAGFTADFAKRLDGMGNLRVSEARHGDRVLAGHVLVAPGGDRHLEVRRYGGEYRVALVPGSAVSGHIPSVDVFFESLARNVGSNASAALLTGMGSDGARGLLALRLAGGRTFAQDRESCAVWGMPAAAVELGACEHTVALTQLPTTLIQSLTQRRRATAVG